MTIAINYILPLFLVANIIVLIHSGGHFVASRLFKIHIERVSIGLGPKVFGFLRNGTAWDIRWLPIGGWVRSQTANEDSGTVARKLGVVLCGPAFSIALAFLALFALFASKGVPVLQIDGLSLVRQSISGTSGAAARALLWSWGTWQISATVAIASSFDTPGFRLACLTAIWSSKFGLLNLIPFPKLDGWNVLRLILVGISGSEFAEKAMGWIFRAIVGLVIMAVAFAAWNDFERLNLR